MTEISYEKVMRVTMSWEKLKRVKDHKNVAGKLIYVRLFDLEPLIALIFGLDPLARDIQKHPRFEPLSKMIFDMIDFAVMFLGPDLEPLADELRGLGKRHQAYGLEPSYLDDMGIAIIAMLQTTLGVEQFSSLDRDAWKEVYGFMAKQMVDGLKK